MKELDITKRYFITGGAGFIGFHLSICLLEKGASVVGYDNMNAYYDVTLKEARLEILSRYEKYTFVKGDIADSHALEEVFVQYQPQIVVNLAAQAGVRYSIENPEAYVQSNLVGFCNILECVRHHKVEHLVYASSSSVYGGNEKVPFSTTDPVDQPVSLYAATKKSNELLAYSYSKLYGIPSTGLRFFTVYGPYGRPDMALFGFTDHILADKPIQIYNYGDMYRDFTYIDDIVTGVVNVMSKTPLCDEKGVPYKIYNIGNNTPEKLMDFVSILEKCLGKEAQKEFLPMQMGDVYQTYADVSELERDFGFKPNTPLEKGIQSFVDWYVEYYGITLE
ncbi:MAG: NAD-dependent epimerase [Eubacteriales bacterium]